MKSLLGEIITWPKKMSMTALIAITVTNEEKAKRAGQVSPCRSREVFNAWYRFCREIDKAVIHRLTDPPSRRSTNSVVRSGSSFEDGK
jgi:hypothetical protein